MQHRPMEASLDELFSDAIARLLMRRDGVAEDVVRQLLRDVKKARRQALDLAAVGGATAKAAGCGAR